jgi:hypothetical protein
VLLEKEAAAAALENVVPRIDRFINNGQLLILPYTEWHLKGGTARCFSVFLLRSRRSISGSDSAAIAAALLCAEPFDIEQEPSTARAAVGSSLLTDEPPLHAEVTL